MQSAAEDGNKAAQQELDELPGLPPLAVNVWEYFLELNSARGSNGFGPSPLSYTEIDAWQRLTKTALDPWELSAILRLDGIFLSCQAKATKAQEQP